MALPDVKNRTLGDKYQLVNIFLVDAFNYYNWFENEELPDTTRKSDKEKSDILPLEGDEEEVRERKGLKTLTPNKLLARLPILKVQIQSGNNSYKLKYEMKQIQYLLQQHNKITKKVYSNLIKSLQQWKKI